MGPACGPITRKEAYACDITYGTNHEFGFDYLRDNMAFRAEELVQRELNYAIVDEVDSILIDEARTPLIISGLGYRSSDMYYKMDRVVRRLVKERDYTIDEKAKTAMLTEEGVAQGRGDHRLRQPQRPRKPRDSTSTSTPPSRPTPCSRRTSTTWSATAR